jgi:PEP-CTERM motif
MGVVMIRILIAAAIFLIHGRSANALLLWNWSYSGAGVSASGTFTTNDAPDAAGFYQIVGITGTDNGATITGLQPMGTPIPGNEPYAVDNLVSAVEPRLTAHGFGFSLTNGDYANPFYNGSNYYEYLSVPPYKNGAGPERPVSFSAAIVPEPSAASLTLAGLVGLIGFCRILKRRTNLDRYRSIGWEASRPTK